MPSLTPAAFSSAAAAFLSRSDAQSEGWRRLTPETDPVKTVLTARFRKQGGDAEQFLIEVHLVYDVSFIYYDICELFFPSRINKTWKQGSERSFW